MKTEIKVGDRVKWNSPTLNLGTMKWRAHTMRGTVYRVDAERVAVMPDAWAKEGHKTGVLRKLDELVAA